MPDHEELEMRTSDFLDAEDTVKRRARLMPWERRMEPTPENDEADEAAERRIK